MSDVTADLCSLQSSCGAKDSQDGASEVTVVRNQDGGRAFCELAQGSIAQGKLEGVSLKGCLGSA